MARCRIVDLRHKQVVNVKDGTCLGCVDDMEIDMATAKLVSIIIYGRLKWFGLLGRCDDICIKWEDIQVIGEDTISGMLPAIPAAAEKTPLFQQKYIESPFRLR